MYWFPRQHIWFKCQGEVSSEELCYKKSVNNSPSSGDWRCNLCDPERGTKKGKKFLEAAVKYTTKVKTQLKATSKQSLKRARYELVSYATASLTANMLILFIYLL